MNSVFLEGGMGNQLFELFALMSYSFKYNKPFVIYSSVYNNMNRVVNWNTLYKYLKPYIVPNIHFREFYLYKEPCFSYSEIPYSSENILLKGFFQSFKYFHEHRQRICDVMHISDFIQDIRTEYAHVFRKTENMCLLSLHFRMGDYSRAVHQGRHPILPLSYYIHALQYLHFLFPEHFLRVLYFCEKDDNDVVLQHTKELERTLFPVKLEFVKAPDEIPDWKQMLMMSACDHHIIANSTFSWWGAYFNESDTKRVCYPSVWFGGSLKDQDTSDLCLPEWTRIDL